MNLIHCYILLVLLNLLCFTLGNYCQKKDSCSSCIRAGSICSWCSKLSYDGFRCELKNITKCPSDEIQDPQNELKVLMDKPLTSNRVGDDFSVTQIRPQSIQMHLRPNVPATIKISYKQAVDYPVDLYYIMDVSKTMSKYKDILSQIGGKLAEEMNKITRNFRLGFGTFIDKTVMPFSDISPGKLETPCQNCAPNYGFKNDLKLTNDALKFSEQIKITRFSGNLDGPEGGFDALMQAIVCTDEIGWRQDARKLLVFATDAPFHLAGDGKMAGIYQPNDMKCHLNSTGSYTHSNILDYPSISQINSKAKENNIFVIFTVTQKRIELYEHLTRVIEGSKVRQLQGDATSTIELIVNTYEKITSGVELVDNLNMKDKEHITMKYYTKCLDGKLKEGSACKGLRVKDRNLVEFQVKITATDCINRTVIIKPTGLSESVKVDIKMKCNCECEKQTSIRNTHCHGNGDLSCGICNCLPTHYGDECECKKDSLDVTSEDIAKRCSYRNQTCSGRGFCSCGKCVKCQTGYEGQFCECEKDSCPKSHGSLCGGSNRGKCDCGQCICNEGWEGMSCECRTPDFCQYDGKECNGNGNCVCGECNCKNDGENVYTGKRCENCPTCGIKCSYYLDRIREQISKKEEVVEKDEIVSTLVKKLEFSGFGREKTCTVLDEDNCQLNFYLKYDEDAKLSIDVLNYTICPKPINVKLTSFSVGGGILATGILALLIWKLITFVQDKNEYAQFLENVKKPNWQSDQNPIFKPSTATFQNPAFNQSTRT